MKTAIMQPYFFPYIGYFSLIDYVEEFIIFDTPQFIRHGWIERNRLITLNGDPFYFRAPLVKHSRETKICDVEINNSQDWKSKILAQLTHYKKKAPFYADVVELLTNIFEKETSSISDLNFYSLKAVCEYLKITTPIRVLSTMDLKLDEVNAPDEWALNISKAIGATQYINPSGGMEFFHREKYTTEGIDIHFLKSKECSYQQFSNEFVPWLSIIDVMMFNSKEQIAELLTQFELV